LQAELEDDIEARMQETERKLLENFDARIHELLKIRHQRAVESLDRITRLFWQLTRFILADTARFDDERLGFTLQQAPCHDAPLGEYRLIRKSEAPPAHAHTYRLTHPLGEYVLDSGRRLDTPVVDLVFDLSGSKHRIAVLEQLPAKAGWLELNLLELHSFEIEEHLVFTALTDDDAVLDQEACERLFTLAAQVQNIRDASPPARLSATAERQVQAALSRALDENDEYFQREREKLEHWAEDQILSAEQALVDTKTRIRDAKRRARLAETVEEQRALQEDLKNLERQQRRQRQAIFDVEDEIEARRDQLIEALEKRMKKKTLVHSLFCIRWQIV
jgi:hypothetical protein